MGPWGWIENDGLHYGHQVINDPQLNLRLNMIVLKNTNDMEWNARIHAEPIDPEKPFNAKLIIYAAYDTQPGKFVGELRDDQMVLAGQGDDFGTFLLRVGSPEYDLKSKLTAVKTTSDRPWDIREAYLRTFEESLTSDEPNVYFYEYTLQRPKTVLLF